MLSTLKKLLRLLRKIMHITRRPYYGFVQGHSHITDSQLHKLDKLVDIQSSRNSDAFESEFANYLGVEHATSFASGRMGFYALLQSLKVKSGNEVILTGSTCAVMANAVLRVGAKPVYADISPKTFGTCPLSVEGLITRDTKVIVAQHSFGIPCDIEKIAKVAREREIFLIEDCALSFDSSLNGTVLGLFGDAALFSFDHTKPINMMIGGMICTNSDLDKKLKIIQDQSAEIPVIKRRSLFKQFKREKYFCNPNNYSQYQVIELLESRFRAIFNLPTPFLTDDSTSITQNQSSYPYPAKMPEFVSYLGRLELKRWGLMKNERQQILKKYIDLIDSFDCKSDIEDTYITENRNIVPLRFVWRCNNGVDVRNKMKDFLQIERTWFTKPIVDTTEPLENFQYIKGSCPISESLEETIINLPTSISPLEADVLITKLSILKK